MNADTPTLFEIAHARRTDPETSHAAADSLTAHTLSASRQAVLTVLRQHGAATDTDLIRRYRSSSDELPQQSDSGIRTRRRELVVSGDVVDSGRRTRLPTGRYSIVWKAADTR